MLELKDFVTGEAQLSGSLLPMIMGMLISFLVGVFALRWLIKMVVADRLHLFAIYCIVVGIATIISQSDTRQGLPGVDAGFYAIAYDWNGETIISFRGTNFPSALVH